jgi:cystathionine beta-lyase/cystathionine gamma-synthase
LQAAIGGQHQIGQDFEALAVQSGGQTLELRAGDHEKSAHRIAQRGARQGLGQPRAGA